MRYRHFGQMYASVSKWLKYVVASLTSASSSFLAVLVGQNYFTAARKQGASWPVQALVILAKSALYNGLGRSGLTDCRTIGPNPLRASYLENFMIRYKHTIVVE